MEMQGIDPMSSYMQSIRSCAELHPLRMPVVAFGDSEKVSRG